MPNNANRDQSNQEMGGEGRSDGLGTGQAHPKGASSSENRGSSSTAGRDVDAGSSRQGDKQYDRQSPATGGNLPGLSPRRGSEVDTDTDRAASKGDWDNNSTKGGIGSQGGRAGQAGFSTVSGMDDTNSSADETQIEGSSGPSPSAGRQTGQKGSPSSQTENKQGGGECGCS
ncbi:MAG: hypothetical protein K2Q09_06365 [Phycisphaerales bacterium]|nr:hypothetical protein [Phycisphaerales bacterium]